MLESWLLLDICLKILLTFLNRLYQYFNLIFLTPVMCSENARAAGIKNKYDKEYMTP